MSQLSECLRGDLMHIAHYLVTTKAAVDHDEIKAILSNLCRRVAAVERRREEDDRELLETAGQ